jgi:hypothetical protein
MSGLLHDMDCYLENRPMQLSDDQVKAFNDAYEKDFGVRLPFEEALKAATRVRGLYLLLSRPLPSERRAQPMPLLSPDDPLIPPCEVRELSEHEREFEVVEDHDESKGFEFY